MGNMEEAEDIKETYFKLTRILKAWEGMAETHEWSQRIILYLKIKVLRAER